jgi:hypothetical protein
LKNGFTTGLCDSYSLSLLYRSSSNHTKDSAARRPRSTTSTAAYMTAQITNATPYIIASTNGCGIYFSNIGPELGWFARLFHLLVQVFTRTYVQSMKTNRPRHSTYRGPLSRRPPQSFPSKRLCHSFRVGSSRVCPLRLPPVLPRMRHHTLKNYKTPALLARNRVLVFSHGIPYGWGSRLTPGIELLLSQMDVLGQGSD